MKRNHGVFFGFAVLLIAAIFIFTGCPTDGGDPGTNPGGGGDDTEAFSISGSFTKSSDAGGGEVKFGLKGNMSRAVTADYTLSGVLEDGDLTIKLKGSYEPNTGRWSVSARSSSIVYTLDGSVDSAGVSQGAIATIAVKSGAEWIPYIFPVREEAVSIPNAGTAVGSEAGGVPAVLQGIWYSNINYREGYTSSINVLVSDWKVSVSGVYSTPNGNSPIEEKWTLIELDESSGSYEVIACYPVYVATPESFAGALRSYLGPTVTVTVIEDDTDTDIFITLAGSPSPEGRYPDGIAMKLYDDNDDTLYSYSFSMNTFDPEPALEAVREKLGAFNGWEQWAASNNVDPVNRYKKIKLSLTDNNSKLNIINMVANSLSNAPDYTYTFSTLAKLKAVEETLEEEHNWEWPDGDGDGPPVKLDPKVMTFTR
ncbi:MAG: hypothetical protein LBQ77_05905 [Treponema sp.]|jgi:hypothetical protein|nr:hypothetical protein [Treponema sp.]